MLRSGKMANGKGEKKENGIFLDFQNVIFGVWLWYLLVIAFANLSLF